MTARERRKDGAMRQPREVVIDGVRGCVTRVSRACRSRTARCRRRHVTTMDERSNGTPDTARPRIIVRPRFLGPAELERERRINVVFARFVGPRYFRRALIRARRSLRLADAPGAVDLIAADPVLLRMVVYTFHPLAWHPAVW